MEEEIRFRANTLEALHETALDLASQHDLPDLLRAIAARASTLLSGAGAAVFLCQPDEHSLEPVLWHNLQPPAATLRLAKGQGVPGKVLETGEPVLAKAGEIWETGDLKAESTGGTSCAAVPIRWGKETLGVILVCGDGSRVLTGDDISLLQQFAPLAGAALEQQRLLQEAGNLYKKAKEDAATKSILLQEVNHRVKNNLSAIIGLLYAERRHAQTKGAADPQTAIQDIIHRVQGLATVHNLLTASEWRPLVLTDLAENIVRSVAGTLPPNQRLSVTVERTKVRVPPAAASSIAMAINEITLNCIKHAIGGRDSVLVSVRVAKQETDGTIELVISDDGPGFPPEVLQRKTLGTGLYVLESIVHRDLGGQLELRNDDGAVVLIRFPEPDRPKEVEDAWPA